MSFAFQSLLFLRARTGQGRTIVELYQELGVFERAAAQPGFLAARLLSSESKADELLVIAEWGSSEAYDEWLASPVRAELSARIEPHLAGEPVVGRWRSELCHRVG